MCGIIGVFGKKNSVKLVSKGLAVLKNRGRDGFGIFDGKKFALGHALHSVVGRVKQPLKDKDVFVSNCEIYNWEALNQEYKLKAKNDSEVLFKLLQTKGFEALNLLDGVYSFAFYSNHKLWVARDIIGVKPVWYSHSNGFYFASEKKALEQIGVIDIQELNPRHMLVYDFKKDSLSFVKRKFFEVTPEIAESLDVIAKKVELLVQNSISKRVPEKEFGLLFSGGIDSTVIALILKKLKHKFTCYTAVLDAPNLGAPQDLAYAKRVAKALKLKHKVVKIKLSQVEKYLETIVPLIEDSNVVKVGVALTFFKACEQASKDGCKVLFSGLGSEEIFAGYQRHKDSYNVNNECVSGLLKMYERDLYRDDVVTMYNGIELRVPFLDKKLVDYSLKIPDQYKLHGEHEKYVLRLVAVNLGLKHEFAFRKKKAAQYGSNFHKAIQKLTNKNKFKLKSDYLRTFYPKHNLKLAALISSGKDSIYAMHIMMKQNYAVKCMVTLKSKNLDSYMFHTPAIDMVELQSKSIGFPLITQSTEGEKEAELEDLKKALETAKKKYGVEGVITGALFSNYQRERIERVCDSLSLKFFSPLWHINQETEMREIVREGFEFIMTKVAADGLDSYWLERRITDKEIDDLVALHNKIGINIAGEGGEFETLVLNGPIFNQKIMIEKSKIVEDEGAATLIVEKAKLINKHEE